MHLHGDFLIVGEWHPHMLFCSSRGLRQGDSLSPYHFVVEMEALNCLINRAVRGALLFGYKMEGKGGKGLVISHLFYSDDTLVF